MLTNILVSLIYCAVCVLVFCHLDKQNNKDKEINRYIFVFMIAAAAAVRVYFALQDYWFPTDVGNFSAWGSFAVNHGLGQMYKQGYFIDYPPGYIYPLYLLTKLNNLLGFEYGSVPYAAVIKLPAMLADFGCAALLYTICREKQGKGCAQFAALAFLFMPVVITNSSMWGQIESYFILFVALSIWFAAGGRTIPAAISFAYALAIKPQAVLFGAVLLFYIVKGKSIREFFKAAAAGLAGFYIIVLPFLANPLDIGWLIKLYPTSMGTYQLVCVNAYNLYYLLGFNWADSSTFPQGAAINFAVIALSVIVTGFVMLKNRDKTAYFATAAVPAAMMFCFCTMMHERYIWPAMFFTFAAWALSSKRMYLFFSLLIGTLNQFNTAWVLAQYENVYWPTETACKTVAFLTVVTTVCYVIWLVYDTAKHTQIRIVTNIEKYIKTEYAVMFITAIYAFVALTGLGSTTAPQSFYQSTDEDNSFVVSFDYATDLEEIYAYCGLGDENTEPYGRKVCGEFEVAVSQNGVDFEYLADLDGFSVYTWKKVSAQAQQVMAVKVTAKNAGAVLHEIVFKDTEGNAVKGHLRDAVADDANPYTAARALDEQHTAPEDTSYYYSMYFDEIYHGRTAYEQIHGLQIYETTHPPLGKILISIGISVFGMTPFGWRVVGALCGVLMLPVMYLLAKALAGEKAGLWACAFMALDFMHLTQTRISTVDTYVVLFVMLTFLFMVYYWKTPFGNIKKEWLCLLSSGVFMGCAVASKWNGAYPMIALAVMFFVCIGAKYKNSGREKRDILYVGATLLYCCFAFVAVPFAIYLASHTVVIEAYTFSDFFRQFVNWQQNMYNYHANLEAEHFFSSMWYTWPFNIKPIWFAVATVENGWISTISSFGNPLIWAVTPFAAAYCLFKGLKAKKVNCLFAALGYIASYVPWMAVTRLCFIYHYFPCAMFGIVCMAIMLRDIVKAKPAAEKAVWAYIALCLVAFVMFLPVTSGIAAPKGYIEFLEMLPQWFFVN